MICKVCGAEMDNNLENCQVCGAVLEKEAEVEEIAEVEATPAAPNKVLGILSLVFGIVGFLPYQTIFSIAAIVLGSIAKKKAAAVGATSPLGKIGVILGIIGAALYVLGTILLGIVYFFIIIFAGGY